MITVIDVNLNDINVTTVRQELIAQFAAHPAGQQFELSDDAHLFVGGRCQQIDNLLGEAKHLHMQEEVTEAVSRLQLVRQLLQQCPEVLFAGWSHSVSSQKPWKVSAAPMFQILQRVCQIGNERRTGMLSRELWQIGEFLGESAIKSQQQTAIWTNYSDQIMEQYVVDSQLVTEQINVLNAAYDFTTGSASLACFQDLKYRNHQYNVLSGAVEAANATVLIWLLEHMHPDVLDAGDRYHSRASLMELAAKDGSINILRLLMPPAVRNIALLTNVLWTAAKYNRVAVIRYLAAVDTVTKRMLRQCQGRLVEEWYDECEQAKVTLGKLIAQTA